MFQFPPFASQPYVFRLGYPAFSGMGFPIQASPGLSLFGSSPELIAAHRAFHRLLVPRHPPYALSSLTTKRSIPETQKTVKAIARFDCQRASAMNAGMEPGLIQDPMSSFMMVEVSGLEPLTPCVQSRCSPN